MAMAGFKRENEAAAVEAVKKLKSASIFADTKDVAEALMEDLRDRFQQLNYKKLKNKKTWLELVCPDMYNRKCYWYMGRSFTARVLKFIIEPPNTMHIYSGRGDGLIKYVTGTPGFGKTVSINTAVGYLYLRSIEATEASHIQTTIVQDATEHKQEGSKAATTKRSIEAAQASHAQARIMEQKQEGKQAAKRKRWSPDQVDFAKHRFLLLSGDDFVESPLEVLHAALVLAYIKNPQALASLDLVELQSEQDLSRFLRLRTETVHIVVDDANSMDINESKDSSSRRAAKEAAWSFLRRLGRKNANVQVVVCASVRSELRRKVLKENAEFRLGTGGYTEDEVVAYLMHRFGETKDACRLRARRVYRRTGWVPGLLSCYLQKKSSLKQIRKALMASVRDALRSDDERGTVTEVLTAIAGGRLELDLSDALDSACYFRGEDGKGQCLAPSLHDETIAHVLQRAKDWKLLSAYEQISLFTNTILGDSNLSRIGWNAEAAVLLALRLLRVRIPDVDVIIEPEEVQILDEKELTKEKLREGEGKKILYIPRHFNHAGVDAYYQCQEALVIVQITVAGNPKKCHPKTEEVAKRLFEGESHVKVVVWNTASLSSMVERPHAHKDYYQVHVSFGELHRALVIIDKRVRELRRGKDREQECRTCHQGLQVGIITRCDFCSDPYHQACTTKTVQNELWYCPDCRLAMGLDEDDVDEVEAVEQDSDYEYEEEEDEEENEHDGDEE